MSITAIQNVFLWCVLINYGVLALWSLLMILPRGWLHQLSGRWYRISPEQFDTFNFAGLVLYKILIILFNLVPYIALLIVG